MTNLLLITSIEKSYDPVIIKEWLNSYSYLYKGFTPNKGQLATMDGKIAENVIFYSKNGNMGIFITENGLSYVIYDIEKKENSKDKKALPHIKEKPENSILHYARIDYELIGGKIKKENIIYQDELPGYENFYLAHCPDGILFVKSYRKVIIKDIYPGINWIFRYDDNGNFHHEFELRNPELILQIKLKVKYADIELVDNGKSIILSTPIGKIKDGNLIGYQGNNIVEVSYKLIDNNLITFDVKSFDKDKPLLIDPYARYALLWSTYYGGSGNDIASSITIDNYGNIFITGNTISIDFPLLNFGWGAYFDGTCGTDGNCNNNGLDAFILKFNNLGLRLWATYYGGSGHDVGESITTDAQGNVFVVGETFSPDFPLYKHVGDPYIQKCILTFNWDIFILKFNNWGVRLWSTCYGGKRHDFVSSIVSDYKSGDIFITGTTGSDDFPTYDPGGGAYYQVCNDTISSAYILRFDNLGTLKWATCYGGSRIDDGISITIDINSNIFLTGKTNSIDFPLYNPGGGAYFDSTCGCDYSGTYYYYDVFIVKFNSLGQRLWATYYGGSREEWGLSMVSDA
ncbi:MAG: SBBP repeat-containing protein [candidate division WOR-3 bacterium]